MRAYLIRRFLMMFPTFIGISLVVFAVLNLTPGRPRAPTSDPGGAVEARSEATEESYQVFSQQFNLDKPVFFNTRFWLETPEVRRDLEVVAELARASLTERIAAQERLLDLGNYAVPHLMRVLTQADAAGQIALRDSAAYFLRSGAPRRLLDPYDPNPAPALRAYNEGVAAELAALKPLRYANDAPEAEKRAVLAAWARWYEGAKSRFEYDARARLRIFFLDTRFATYWSNLIRLDLGISLATREPVLPTLLSKLVYSVALSLSSLLLAFLLAIPIGIFSAVRRGTRAERALTTATFMLYSLPSFFVATVLLYFLSAGSFWSGLRLFPTGGFRSLEFDDLTTFGKLRDILWHLVLPVGCMTYGWLAGLSRYMRVGLLEVIHSDYVRTARAKGLPERLVIGKHALRNGLLPIITLLADLLPAVLGGSAVIEYIFGIPGIGLWTVDSIYQRDYTVLMGVQLVSSVLVLIFMLLADVGYALLDPRIRYH